ncbi:MAG: histidinol dehydrogenase [Clostridium sp.]
MLKIYEYNEKTKVSLLKDLKEREDEDNREALRSVEEILKTVRENGNQALKSFTKKFDGIEVDDFLVSDEEIEESIKQVDESFVEALKESKKNIEDYHMLQKQKGYILTKDNGVYLGQRVLPLSRVGVYVPGGSASYPSSVLMNVIPAKVAGVKEVIMVTPPGKDGKINGNIAMAAVIAGVDKIYKVGGAQAIGALAYGTETIDKVDKIVGPGNIFVALAKKCVFGQVDIDMIAGPSEILVIAEEESNPRYIAADLMSQGEHDVLASSILLTTSRELAKKVNEELEIQVEGLERKDIIKASLKKYGKCIICNSIDECLELSNIIAPEHLELCVKNPMELLEKVENAGSVFLGENTPEPVGDYFGGTNHVLPTNGTARFFSPLSVDSFIKKSSFLYYSREALVKHGEKIVNIAKREGLTAHANSIKVRLEK